MTITAILLFIYSNIFALDIETAISFAVNNNPDLVELSNEIILQDKIIKSVVFELYPDLNVDMNYASAGNYYDVAVQMSYPLFNGGQDKFHVKYESIKRDYLSVQYDMKKKEIEYQTKVLFYNTVLAEKTVSVRESNIQQAVNELNVAEAKYDEGLIDSYEYTAAKQFFLDNQYYLINAKNIYDQALINLKQYISYYDFSGLEGELYIETQPQITGELYEVKVLKLKRDLIKLYYAIEEDNYKWQVDLYTQYDYSIYADQMLNNHSVYFGLKIYFPLSDWFSATINPSYYRNNPTNQGFSIQSSLSLMDENYSAYYTKYFEANLNLELKNIESQITQKQCLSSLTGNKLLELKMKLSMNSNNILINRLNYQKVNMLYQSGQKTAMELFDAKLSVIEAEIDYYKAIFDYDSYAWQIESERFDDH